MGRGKGKESGRTDVQRYNIFLVQTKGTKPGQFSGNLSLLNIIFFATNIFLKECFQDFGLSCFKYSILNFPCNFLQ